ncbi:universal stress protein [Sphingobium sp. HDIP04]|uniref:universal stress protein n=1 Tax=Sphingobium sp. HDIP04 TaxID=428994 RepID=UPI001EE727BF|nr:universal stress protein [Sphingobium sp. HDIP04]
MYKRILISTDGSEVAQKGVDHGLALAKALGVNVTIITVTERFQVYSGVVGYDLEASRVFRRRFHLSHATISRVSLAA